MLLNFEQLQVGKQVSHEAVKKKPKWDTYFIMEQSSPLEMRRVGILWANKLSKMNWPWKLPAVKVALIKSIMKASVMLNYL